VVDVATVGSLGAVLVTRAGRTLYRYAPDGTGRSVCTGECASAWPPLTVPAGTEHVAGGARIPGSDLGTTTRSDGTLQVTYRGMPLYTYVGDAKAGDATGQGLGGTWFVVPTSSSPASTTTSPPSPGGHGY
jgi:predicted lipoprotein with Yx(FWY)xxD motif